MYRIKHIPSGLYYQPHKHKGNNLSKTGKIYAKESYAKSAYKAAIGQIQLTKGSQVWKICEKKGLLVTIPQTQGKDYIGLYSGINNWIIEKI